MQFNAHDSWVFLVGVYYFCKLWYKRISAILLPIIQDIETRAQDGIITKAERKEITMNTLSREIAKGNIKLNFIDRFLLSKIVDHIAEELPDFKISQNTKAMLNETIQIMSAQSKNPQT